MNCFGGIFQGSRVLITGHTGFKGSWLALWLQEMGAHVTGLSLPPETTPNHWDMLALEMPDLRIDIRNDQAVLQAFTDTQPELVFHLAAQPLVRRSYNHPLETWSTNTLGTAHVLDAARKTPSVRAIVIVTTDKVYENREWPWRYREIDQLGGHDPYSASKAAAELVAASFRKAYFEGADSPLLATARAGNVIGGGDWSADRLIPDLVRAVEAGHALEIRSPASVRPWQHVLDCLNGYLTLGAKLLSGQRQFADAWNFGPEASAHKTVNEILITLKEHWPELKWAITTAPQSKEMERLELDDAKSRLKLGWQPTWSLETALALTASWYRAPKSEQAYCSRQQLADYCASARAQGRAWAMTMQ